MFGYINIQLFFHSTIIFFQVEHVTDSEIEDLTKKSTISVHTTTTKVQLEATTSPPPLSSSDTKSSVDRLIQPEARLHTNSRFNMTTGGIAVLICATVAVVFYAGIMIWKRISMYDFTLLSNFYQFRVEKL